MDKQNYNTGFLNIITDEYQVIRLSEGCPHRCPWCYEWRYIKEWRMFPIPAIFRRDVRIVDMNLIAKPHALSIIRKFKDIRVDGKVVYPWLVCGIDYRFLTQAIANALKESRFIKPHLAWDWHYRDQRKIRKAIDKLLKAGYKEKDVSVFMICNHPAISYRECCKKLDLCKYWRIKVNDCYYDNQTSPNIIPIGWTGEQIKLFRKAVRKHNQLCNFMIDPELRG